jgi:cytoskeletal protein RodZ
LSQIKYKTKFMNLTGIISISGKSGLFKVVAQSKNSIIVESLIDKKRSPAYSTDRISALDDISIYTYEEDFPLKEVYAKIYEKEQGKDAPSHKENLSVLEAYLEAVLPNYDKARVYPSDIKKLFQWYNLLNAKGLTKPEEKTETAEETAEKPAKAEKKATAKAPKAVDKAVKKEAPKKAAPAVKKAPPAKKVASNAKKG